MIPPIDEILSLPNHHRAAHEGNWGTVPLSVGESHLPFISPLRIGYETRDRVDEMFHLLAKEQCLQITTESLAEILMMVASTIDHKVALTLAIETINGMAKTAPMTVKALQQAQQDNARQPG